MTCWAGARILPSGSARWLPAPAFASC